MLVFRDIHNKRASGIRIAASEPASLESESEAEKKKRNKCCTRYQEPVLKFLRDFYEEQKQIQKIQSGEHILLSLTTISSAQTMAVSLALTRLMNPQVLH